MRRMMRALAGAAASMALGALFTGVALAAEPTADADADADLTLGLVGDEQDTSLDASLGGILGLNDADSADADTAASVIASSFSDTTASLGLVADAAADPDAASGADADGDATLSLRTAQANLAGAGMGTGSVMNIDLDAGANDDAADATFGFGLASAGKAGTDVTALTAPADKLAATSIGTLGAVLSGGATGPRAETGGGGETTAAPAGRTGTTGGSLPDTALAVVGDMGLSGSLLIGLAALAASRRRLPLLRR